MSKLNFLFIDQFQAAPDWDKPYLSWVIGPANYPDVSESIVSTLNLYADGERRQEVRCGLPSAADRFPSVLDERRLRRVWQEGDFIATTMSVGDLQAASKSPIRFFTSEPARFCRVGGKVKWNLDAKVMRQTDVSTAWWRPDKSVSKASRFLIDVPGIPLSVTYSTGGSLFEGVIAFGSYGSDTAEGIVVLRESETAHLSENIDVIYRNERIATLLN